MTIDDDHTPMNGAQIPDITPADFGAGPGDPGYCGLGLETGPLDPWWKRMCQRHDKSFNELKAGTYQGSGFQVAGRAAIDVLGGVAAGAYMIVSAPVYFVGAVFGGLIRWGQLERQAGVSYRPLPPPGDDESQ